MERRYFRACAEHFHDLGFDDDPPRSKGRQLVPIGQYLARTRIMRDPAALKLALPGPAWPGQSGGPEHVLQVALAAASAARADAAKPWAWSRARQPWCYRCTAPTGRCTPNSDVQTTRWCPRGTIALSCPTAIFLLRA